MLTTAEMSGSSRRIRSRVARTSGPERSSESSSESAASITSQKSASERKPAGELADSAGAGADFCLIAVATSAPYLGLSLLPQTTNN